MAESNWNTSLDICGELCPIACIDFRAVRPPVLNEVIMHLQWDWSIAYFTDTDLERLRTDEIESWAEDGGERASDAVSVLQDYPQLLSAARACVKLQQTQECTYLEQMRERES